MNNNTIVAVAMSGGFDSSVAALLLKNQGYKIIGIYMKNWVEDDCSAIYDIQDVKAVCKQLDIPHYLINFSKEYREKVFSNFLKEYEKGNTPNPDILCNKEIKFDLLLKKAKELKADFLATGHYAQNINNSLYKAKDLKKDQSYFLYTINSNILKEIIFPLGQFTKADIRKIAKENKLATSDKKESMGICFIGKKNFTPFLSSFLGFKKGNTYGRNDACRSGRGLHFAR